LQQKPSEDDIGKCICFTRALILQFLLLPHTPTPSKRKETAAPDKSKVKRNRKVVPTVRQVQFDLLQEAARMELVRTLEATATALITCDKSVVMEANQYNFMVLVAQLRDPRLLSDISIFNIPNESTFLDYKRITGVDTDPPGRYWWDKEIFATNPRDSGTASFARFQLQAPGQKSSSTAFIGQWKDDTSIIENLLIRVTGRIQTMETLVQELREMYIHLSLLLPLQCTKQFPLDVPQVTAHYNELFQHLKKQDSKTLLFQRRQDKLKDMNSDFFNSSVSSQENATSSNEPTITVEEHTSNCETILNEYLNLPYTYNMLGVFLFEGAKIPKDGLEKLEASHKRSFNFKMNQLATAVLSAHDVLVRTRMPFHTKHYLICRSCPAKHTPKKSSKQHILFIQINSFSCS